MNATYLRYEFLRLWRNKRFFFFSLVFPLILFLVFGVSNKNANVAFGSVTLKFILFYMVGMAGYGAMMAAISGGARIAAERQVGWNRQLRLTPLRVPTYFAAKILTSYVMALISIAVLFLAGLIFGVHVPVSRWAEMIGLILVGLLPFIAIGIIIGHLLTVDSTRTGPRWRRRLVRPARRHVVPLHQRQHAAEDRRVRPVLLDRPGGPGRRRGQRLAGEGLAGDRVLDRGDGGHRRPGLPTRHQARLT